MPDGLTYLWLILGFGFILVAGARLGAGSHTALAGLFPSRPVIDWPSGVQEGDAPRFDVAHLDALQHGMTVIPPVREHTATSNDEPASIEIVDLYERPLDLERLERPKH
jgi:hypothetical protein